ncbi:PhnD/SsuA/transferrin family substrate-binding protein [Oscillatoriales cyanobacterium LEGE 11467]|uniref:PhnD/SsuA/transferrin family substrate-binding protein n=1 Tax=Zarconia navalis LEGE 11467 TaxID=1828826 RepID=A0A928Z7L8_9CYAN|nr:phosphate/phosphite/phosphonate ABC transporter substrate-binding protein [Zarconia navalis]MBE9041572.1 PhnD/SsuA/transferrin family substrate-binding protein [Zarconia navalis LEGE 11467]
MSTYRRMRTIAAAIATLFLISCQQSAENGNTNPATPSATDSASEVSADTSTLFQDGSLTVGVLTTPYNLETDYVALEQHLEAEFGENVDVRIDSVALSGNDGFAQVRNQIVQKQWDVAFTTSPMMSVAAINNDYQFAARMFPQASQFESVLFVRKDSPIQGISDLTPDIKLALGDFNSAAAFYIPVYDLYGKTLQVDLGNTNTQSTIEKVKSGQIDVGSGAYQIVENDDSLRAISRSRSIPLSGVYLSPDLSDLEREAISRSLENAPDDVKNSAKYGEGEEPDYQYFIGITNRVDEVLGCVDWQQQPVQLFCENTATQSIPTGTTISGQVNGYQVEGETINFILNGEDGTVYRVIVPRTLLDRIPNGVPLPGLHGKTFQIVGIEPQDNRGTLELTVTTAEQLQIDG